MNNWHCKTAFMGLPHCSEKRRWSFTRMCLKSECRALENWDAVNWESFLESWSTRLIIRLGSNKLGRAPCLIKKTVPITRLNFWAFLSKSHSSNVQFLWRTELSKSCDQKTHPPLAFSNDFLLHRGLNWLKMLQEMDFFLAVLLVILLRKVSFNGYVSSFVRLFVRSSKILFF